MKLDFIGNEVNTDSDREQYDFPYCKDWYMIGPEGQEVDVGEINSSFTREERLAKVMKTITNILRCN